MDGMLYLGLQKYNNYAWYVAVRDLESKMLTFVTFICFRPPLKQ